MDSVIRILEDMESHLDGTPGLPVIELFRELGCQSEFGQTSHVPVTSPSLNLPYLSEQQRSFLKHLQKHRTGGSWTEYGAVLTPDGTTVSLSPLLGGIVGGLTRGQEGAVPCRKDPLNSTHLGPCRTLDPLLAPLAKGLAVAFSLFHGGQSQALLGPDGCWDDILAPHKFTLLSPPSPVPDAFINGAMDGVIVGSYLAENASSPPNISSLLRRYYAGEGLAGGNQTQSNFRRRNFADLVSQKKLREELEGALCLLRHLHGSPPLLTGGVSSTEEASLLTRAVEEFSALYVGLWPSHGGPGGGGGTTGTALPLHRWWGSPRPRGGNVSVCTLARRLQPHSHRGAESPPTGLWLQSKPDGGKTRAREKMTHNQPPDWLCSPGRGATEATQGGITARLRQQGEPVSSEFRAGRQAAPWSLGPSRMGHPARCLPHHHTCVFPPPTECPAIIPRCMWGAQPYRGTPTLLRLPLGFVYIHHTHSPGKPCRTFPECAADMRSMQRFHQVVRGWDDIGYR